jgi:hypothetical protein
LFAPGQYKLRLVDQNASWLAQGWRCELECWVPSQVL